MAGEEWLHHSRQTLHRRRQQRRPAGGGGPYATPRPLSRGDLQLSAARHGALPEFSGGQVLGVGIWLLRRCGATALHPEILALPEREGGHALSRGAVCHRRFGYAGSAAARAQDDRAAAIG